MSYTIVLPEASERRSPTRLDIVDGSTTAVQRALRRNGLAGYEPPTVAALLTLWERADPEFTFFDVGANMGLYAHLCARMFEPRTVVGIEPTPSTASVARRVARANASTVRVEELAFGSRSGTADLYLSARSDASNSLVEGFKRSTGTIAVPVETLDSYVRRSGFVPDVIKIDVETFEPDVIAGARDTIEKHQPTMVVEVLKRRGHDHGEELTEAMAGLGYHYYALDDHPTWEASASIVGRPGGQNQDWLLSPTPLDTGFVDRAAVWSRALTECTPDRNGRLPVIQTVKAVYRSEGLSGIRSGVRNRLRKVTRSG